MDGLHLCDLLSLLDASFLFQFFHLFKCFFTLVHFLDFLFLNFFFFGENELARRLIEHKFAWRRIRLNMIHFKRWSAVEESCRLSGLHRFHRPWPGTPSIDVFIIKIICLFKINCTACNIFILLCAFTLIYPSHWILVNLLISIIKQVFWLWSKSSVTAASIEFHSVSINLNAYSLTLVSRGFCFGISFMIFCAAFSGYYDWWDSD